MQAPTMPEGEFVDVKCPLKENDYDDMELPQCDTGSLVGERFTETHAV